MLHDRQSDAFVVIASAALIVNMGVRLFATFGSALDRHQILRFLAALIPIW